MPDEGPPVGERVGIELFVGGAVEAEPAPEDEEYAPARGGPWRGSRAARVTQLGQDALTASARLVGEQVGAVVRETLAGMDRAKLAEATAAGLRPSSVQLSFGVKLSAGRQGHRGGGDRGRRGVGAGGRHARPDGLRRRDASWGGAAAARIRDPGRCCQRGGDPARGVRHRGRPRAHRGALQRGRHADRSAVVAAAVPG